MKDFEQHIKPDQDNKQLSAEQRQVRTEKHMRTVAYYPGHTIWEFEVSTGVIVPAKIEVVNMQLATVKPQIGVRFKISDTVDVVRKKIMERLGCLYCSALNYKNAHKRFMKMYTAYVKAGIIIQPKHEQK